jgi:cysteine desulfurase
VKGDGLIDLDMLREAITDKTILISIMRANNEIGVLQPIAEIGRMARERGVLFHTDAVQAVGKIPVNVEKDNIDLMSISGHKIYGPKGVGALYCAAQEPARAVDRADGRRRARARHALRYFERAGIVGLGEACELCGKEMAEESARLGALRDKLRHTLESALDEVYINGSMEHRLPNNLNMSFAYVEGESMLMGIKDIAVSSGSACTSASLEPSYVLKALGVGDDLAHTSIRFGLGRFNTEEEVDYTRQR